jgi:carbon-monoxide dehydrogenase large subunit
VAARKIRDKARKIAAHLLEANEEDLEWTNGKFSVKGSPDKSKTIQEIAFAAYTNHPQGMEAGLEAVDYYDPPNLTFPFGSYICVVDIDKGTGEVKVRRFVAVDDCGNIINPMIVDGQIHGGLTMGLAPALYEQITYDELGNNLAGTFMDYLLPTAVETPAWETDKTVTPCRITRSAPRGSASRPRSARRRRSPMPSSTRCGTSASATSTSRSPRRRSGRSCARRE